MGAPNYKWVRRMISGCASVSQKMPGDDQPLDLGGALVDRGDLRVAEVALDGRLAHVAVAAVDLDRLGRHPHRGLGGEQFGHRGLLAMGLAGVLEAAARQVSMRA